MRNLLIFVLLLFIGCENSQKLGIPEILTLSYRLSKGKISGTAVKGIYKNAQVRVYSVSSNGNCNKDNLLGSGFTDDKGQYSVSYSRTGGLLCVVVEASSNGKSQLYDEKLAKDIAILPDSNLTLQTIVPEGTVESRQSPIATSPISRIVLSRLQNIAKDNTDPTKLAAMYRKASKEAVIRFGLNKGVSSKSLSDEGVPTLEELTINWQNTSDPTTLKNLLVLAGISQLSHTFKQGNETTSKDIDALIQVFQDDASDGLFDGKDSSGKALTFPGGTPLGNDPLANHLGKAISQFVKDGGQIGIGSGTPVTIPITTLNESISFNGVTPIVSTETFSTPAPVVTVGFSSTGNSYSENIGTISIPVVLSGALAQPITVSYSVTAGTATGGGVDYTLNSGTLNFDAGVLSQNISIPIVNDTLVEGNETIQITLSSPTNAVLGIANFLVTILDDEPSVYFASPSGSGPESIPNPTVAVHLSAPVSYPITVNYTVGGTATGGGVDHSLSNGSITFNPGVTTVNLPNFGIIDDTSPEPNETIVVNLAAGANYYLGSPVSYTYTINDNDPSINYPNTNILLVNGQGFSLVPTIAGTITNCTASPTLPAGLTLNSSNCTISGAPTNNQSASTYTINAQNDYGSSINASVQIQVIADTNCNLAGQNYRLTTINQSCDTRCSSHGGLGTDSIATNPGDCFAVLGALGITGSIPIGGHYPWSGYYPCMYERSYPRYITSNGGISIYYAHSSFNIACPCQN